MGPVILFVEDDDVFRRIVARALRAHGFAVREAPSSEAAVQALEQGLCPDLVLLDLNLPGRTGWDLLRGAWLAAAGAPPVVAVSATAPRSRWMEEFQLAGYLPKPFPLETLISCVERLTRPAASQVGVGG